MSHSEERSTSLVDRDRQEAGAATDKAVDLLKMLNVDLLGLLKDAYQLGFTAGLRHERHRFGTDPEPLKGEACGRWVGDKHYWDIEGETVSDDALSLWIRNNLPEESAFNSTAGGIVAYHTRAYANRRQAMHRFMRALKW